MLSEYCYFNTILANYAKKGVVENELEVQSAIRDIRERFTQNSKLLMSI